ncbi:MAG: DUF4174 domain-containing protein [Opitutales bacterium]
MKTLIFYFTLLAVLATNLSGQDMPSDAAKALENPPISKVLKPYLWENRLLLILTPSANDPEYRHYLEEIDRTTALWEARDLLIGRFVIGQGGTLGPNYYSADDLRRIRADFELPKEGLVTALVGKDGSVKLQLSGTIPLTQLISFIDRMPMRQLEMRHEEALATKEAKEAREAEIAAQMKAELWKSGAPRTYQAIAAAFLDAHKREDMLSVLELVYMEASPPFIRQQLVRSFEEDFRYHIDRIRIEPAKKDQLNSYTYQGIKYVTTLPVLANMVLEYGDLIDPNAKTGLSAKSQEEAEEFTGTTYPLGIKNGRVYIVTAMEAPGE